MDRFVYLTRHQSTLAAECTGPLPCPSQWQHCWSCTSCLTCFRPLGCWQSDLVYQLYDWCIAMPTKIEQSNSTKIADTYLSNCSFGVNSYQHDLQMFFHIDLTISTREFSRRHVLAWLDSAEQIGRSLPPHMQRQLCCLKGNTKRPLPTGNSAAFSLGLRTLSCAQFRHVRKKVQKGLLTKQSDSK